MTGKATPTPTPRPWTVFRCGFCQQDNGEKYACGFNGSSLDASMDECHHTLLHADAKLIVKCVNAHDELVEALKQAKEVLSNHFFYHDEEDEYNNDDVIEAHNKCEQALAKVKE